MNPTVSFVVPCYKLAHLLGECVDSILGQTYRDFEVLIMDDCSPDNTPEVARAFTDHRVRYIRNEENLGHLKNYNKGISLAKGKYIWLISADDKIRTPHTLNRYVEGMDRCPSAGFAFCPGVGLIDGREMETLAYSFHGDTDELFAGRSFFSKLLASNSVLAAAGMVRKECYENLGTFPLDLPYAGDWYLWLLFSLHYDVLYFAEPMVCYRQHVLSMSCILDTSNPRTCTCDDLRVLWRVKQKAEEAGRHELAVSVDDFIIKRSAAYLIASTDRSTTKYITLKDFADSVAAGSSGGSEARKIYCSVYALVADSSLWKGDYEEASLFYVRSLKANPLNLKTLLKYLLLHMGSAGRYVREAISIKTPRVTGRSVGVEKSST